MKIKWLLVFGVLFLATNTSEAQVDKEYFKELEGVWQSENKKQHIKVFYVPKKKMYYGKVIWMYEDDEKEGRVMYDVNNSDPKLRSRRVTGILLIYNLKFAGNDEFKGYIYDPISGKSYKSNLKLMPDRKTAEIRGYIFHPIFGRTEIATKIE